MAKAATTPMAAGPCSRTSAKPAGDRRLVAEPARQHQDDDKTDDARQIGAVSGLEPVEVAETVASTLAAQRAEGCCTGRELVGHVRERYSGAPLSPVAAGRAGSADQPDHEATYSRASVKPAVRGRRGWRRPTRPTRSRPRPPRRAGRRAASNAGPKHLRGRKRPVAGSRLPCHGAFAAPGMCPARGSTGSVSPR